MKRRYLLLLLLLTACSPELYITGGSYTITPPFTKAHNHQRGTLSAQQTALLREWVQENLSLFSLSIVTWVPAKRIEVDELVFCLSPDGRTLSINSPSAQYAKAVEPEDAPILRLLRLAD